MESGAPRPAVRGAPWHSGGDPGPRARESDGGDRGVDRLGPGGGEGSLSESLRGAGKQNNQKIKHPPPRKPQTPNNLKTPKPKEFPETSSFLRCIHLLFFFLPRLAVKTGCFPF